MAEPFLGEIRIASFGFAPKGWAMCNGQLLPINQNQALFAILGTTYGGDGRTTFALPDLRSRTPISFGGGPGLASYNLGQSGGAENVTLTQAQTPAHVHALSASTLPASTNLPANDVLAKKAKFGVDDFVTSNNTTPMNPQALSVVGSGSPHENRQPFLSLNFVIALQGIFPSQN